MGSRRSGRTGPTRLVKADNYILIIWGRRRAVGDTLAFEAVPAVQASFNEPAITLLQRRLRSRNIINTVKQVFSVTKRRRSGRYRVIW